MGQLLPFFLMYLGGIFTVFHSFRDFLVPGLLPLALMVGGAKLYRRTPNRWFGGWILLALLYGYGIHASLPPPKPPDHIVHHLREDRFAEVIGNITEKPVLFKDRTQYHIELASINYGESPIPVTGFARINHFAMIDPLSLGDIVRLKKIRLKLPRNFKNPGRFDFRQHIHSLGIDVIGNISKDDAMERLGSHNPPALKVTVTHVKKTMSDTIYKYLSVEEGSLLEGMVLGETQSIPPKLQGAYKTTGLTHLLAVSGMNFTFLAAAIYLVFNRLVFLLCIRCFPKAAKSGFTRKIMAFLCLPPVLCYMLLVGIKISSLRAGIMVIIFLLSIFVERENNMFNSLLISAFLILLVSPDAITNISFQLSFAGVFAILYAAHFYEPSLEDPISTLGEKKWSALLFIRGNLLVTLAATLGTLPILLFTFNRVSLIGVALNLIMVPLSTILMPFGLLVLTLGLISQNLAGLLLPVCSLLLKPFVIIPQWAEKIPYASIYAPSPPKLWLVLYCFVLLGVPYWIDRNRRAAALCDDTKKPGPWNKPLCAGLGIASLGLVVWFIWPRFPESPAETLTACVLDVGQGESIFVEFPSHETLLIDGGGLFSDTFDVGQNVIAPFLWNRGIRRIDYMVATHADRDHIKGLESLVTFFPVGHYLARREDILSRELWEFRKTVAGHQIKLVPLETGKPLWISGASVTQLHPSADYSQQTKQNIKETNNSSLVLRLEYRTFSMLLTADIAAPAEQYLVRKGAPLRADFLKAPHHGSKYSSSPPFIQAVSPRTVLISSGYLNNFHHPNPEVLERYQNFSAQILRTDQQGALCITTDGMDHRIETHESL